MRYQWRNCLSLISFSLFLINVVVIINENINEIFSLCTFTSKIQVYLAISSIEICEFTELYFQTTIEYRWGTDSTSTIINSYLWTCFKSQCVCSIISSIVIFFSCIDHLHVPIQVLFICIDSLCYIHFNNVLKKYKQYTIYLVRWIDLCLL